MTEQSHHGWDLWIASPIVHLSSCDPSRITLHDRGEDTYERWAVHTECLPTDGRKPFLFFGLYTDDLSEATAEFGRRAKADHNNFTAQQQTLAHARDRKERHAVRHR